MLKLMIKVKVKVKLDDKNKYLETKNDLTIIINSYIKNNLN